MPRRPRSGALHTIAAFTLAAHALLIGLAWRDAEPPKPRPPQRVAMRLVAVPAATPPRTVVHEPTVRPALPTRRAPVRVEPPRPAVAPPPEVVTGVAFAPPRLGVLVTAPATWLKPPPTEDMPAAAMAAQAAMAHAAREAARSQIAYAMQRARQAAPPADGRCALLPDDAPTPACTDQRVIGASVTSTPRDVTVTAPGL